MRVRKVNGATSGLAVSLAIFLVLIGVGTFFLIQIFSGSRQVTTATDAGALNVAVAAALVPSIPLASSTNTLGLSTAQIQVEEQIQAVLGNDPTTGNPNNVNLLNINKVIGYGFIIALNAAAEGTSAGKTNAQAVQSYIEGTGSNSITSRLAAALISPSTNIYSSGQSAGSGQPTQGPWVSTFFSQGANANPQGLANPSSQVAWQSGSFQTAYLGINDATNVQASSITNNLPYTNIDSGNRLSNPLSGYTTADGYIQGYTGIPVKDAKGNVVTTYYFVTNYGDQSPGLRSNYEFSLGKTQPGAGSVTLPPNTFLNQATIAIAQLNSASSGGGTTGGNQDGGNNNQGNGNGTSSGTGTSITQTSIATVGTKSFPAAVPIISGYIVFDNTPQYSYTGPLPTNGTANVNVQEITYYGNPTVYIGDQYTAFGGNFSIGPVIYVVADTSNNYLFFTLNPQVAVDIWDWWDYQGGKTGAALTSNLSNSLSTSNITNEVFDYATGNMITTSNLYSTLYGKLGNTKNIAVGVTAWSFPGGAPYTVNPLPAAFYQEIPIFNKVYHLNTSPSQPITLTSTGLSATELAKDELINAWWSAETYINNIYPPQTVSGANANQLNPLVFSFGPIVSGIGAFNSYSSPFSGSIVVQGIGSSPWGTQDVYTSGVDELGLNTSSMMASSNGSAATMNPSNGQITGTSFSVPNTYCCPNPGNPNLLNYVDPTRMGKVTLPIGFSPFTGSGIQNAADASLPIADVFSQITNTAFTSAWVPPPSGTSWMYTEQISNGTTVSTNQYSTYGANSFGDFSNPSGTVNFAAITAADTALYNWFLQRCMEMGATQAQVTNVWNSLNINLNTIGIVYMSNGTLTYTNSSQTITATTTTTQTGSPVAGATQTTTSTSSSSSMTNFTPTLSSAIPTNVSQWLQALYTNTSYPLPYPNISTYTGISKSDLNTVPIIDGQTYAYSRQANIFGNIVNAGGNTGNPNQGGSDFNTPPDLLFVYNPTLPTGCLVATDYVYVQSATGAANGCLARIAFRERVDNGPGPLSPSLSVNASSPTACTASTPLNLFTQTYY